MRRAIEHFAAGAWPEEQAADSLTLIFDDRHRRRIRLASDAGEPVLLDLPKAIAMADGDGLHCDDGLWIAVRAATEKLVEIQCGDARSLARVAWHLGNRHLPTQLHGTTIRIRPDHVIEDMVRGLGAQIRFVTAAFQPEGGAYESETRQQHHHHHNGHSHAH